MRMSSFTRTDQKPGSFTRSSRWKEWPWPDGSICRSKAVVFTAFCSGVVSRASAAVKLSAMRKCIVSDYAQRPDI